MQSYIFGVNFPYSSTYESVIVNLQQFFIKHEAFLEPVNSLNGLNGCTNSVKRYNDTLKL